jgi:hypothetical protein
MFRILYYSFLILLICFTANACRRLPPPPEGLPQLYPCKITVTFGGEKIEGVTVSLMPTDPSFKWKSGGKTNKDGVAELRTSFAYPGVPEGTFIVAFDKIEDSYGDTIETTTPFSLFPLKYRPEQSTEVVEIKKGKNEFTFTLDGGKERLPIPKDAVIRK